MYGSLITILILQWADCNLAATCAWYLVTACNKVISCIKKISINPFVSQSNQGYGKIKKGTYILKIKNKQTVFSTSINTCSSMLRSESFHINEF